MIIKQVDKLVKAYDASDYESDIIEDDELKDTFPNAEFIVYQYMRGHYEGYGFLLTLESSKWRYYELSHCSCHGPLTNSDDSELETPEGYDTLDDILTVCSEHLKEQLTDIVLEARKYRD